MSAQLNDELRECERQVAELRAQLKASAERLPAARGAARRAGQGRKPIEVIKIAGTRGCGLGWVPFLPEGYSVQRAGKSIRIITPYMRARGKSTLPITVPSFAAAAKAERENSDNKNFRLVCMRRDVANDLNIVKPGNYIELDLETFDALENVDFDTSLVDALFTRSKEARAEKKARKAARRVQRASRKAIKGTVREYAEADGRTLTLIRDLVEGPRAWSTAFPRTKQAKFAFENLGAEDIFRDAFVKDQMRGIEDDGGRIVAVRAHNLNPDKETLLISLSIDKDGEMVEDVSEVPLDRLSLAALKQIVSRVQARQKAAPSIVAPPAPEAIFGAPAASVRSKASTTSKTSAKSKKSRLDILRGKDFVPRSRGVII